MKKKIKNIEINEGEAGSFYSYLSNGCKLCQQGAKMVLFVTGSCTNNCFYCPISDERIDKKTVYANEESVVSDIDVLSQARKMSALGTGITGGEPLMVLEKTIYYIKLLKKNLGEKHHIHLYTSYSPTKDILKRLLIAGLDEIRFHPPLSMWKYLNSTKYITSILAAKELGLETGIEVPSIEGIEHLIENINDLDIFLNLNELEFSDTNSNKMIDLNYRLKDDISNAAMFSREYALKVASSMPKFHFCSSRYKDAIQLRRRLIRIAKNTARPFDEITNDGTIVYGIIKADHIKDVVTILTTEGVPTDMFEMGESSITIAWWILDDISNVLTSNGFECTIIEKYPLTNGLVVASIPL
ncbi:radical SAM protein [Methanosalsum natronophilum]|uniref:Radical SAM protein n=1 Tax=Methanosalsum natronophilum TaxID=768733 RepID=A0A3R7WF98_9EURY|nr:MAG: radical SAM protein [Methanosalsum natronophilum]